MPEQAPTLDEVFSKIQDDAVQVEQQQALRTLGALPDGPGPELDAYLDRVLETIGRLKKEVESTKATAELRMADIKHWRDEKVESADHQIAFLQRQVEALVEQHRYDFAGKKSKDLPHGTFGRRVSKRAGIEIKDEAAAMEFARTRVPDAIKVKESLLKTPLLEYYLDGKKRNPDWKLPDGCEFREKQEEFYVDAVLPGR